MTAIGTRLIFRSTGKPADVLEVESFTPRQPEPGEVLVRMVSAPINPADLNTIEGTYGVKLDLPATPGIEGTGVVVESTVERFAEGDCVMFLKRSESWASHTTVPADILFKLPSGIDPVQAAMLKVNPATAWRLLHGFKRLEKGEWIIQNAGNSAVGRCVIQLAKDAGIKTISFVRRPDLREELETLGADAVFTDDDAGHAAAKELLGGANAALAFNAVGGDSALGLLKLLREGSTHVTYGAMGRRPVTVPNGLLIFRDISVRGLWITKWLERAPSEQVAEIYTTLAGKVRGGEVIQKVDSLFAVQDFRHALTRLGEPGRDGKVLFTF